MSRIRAEHSARYALALTGDIPAEALSTTDRGRLIWTLWQNGWDDRAIAEHTRTTDYTTRRIRLRQAALRGRDLTVEEEMAAS